MFGGEPTVAGFTTFIRSVMGIDTTALPVNAPIIDYVFSAAIATVYLPFCSLGGTLPGSWSLYEIATYNLAGDFLVNWAPDTAPSTYFADLREKFGVYSFLSGVVSSTFDQGTGQTMTVGDWAKGLTLGDLQRLKTPWGRQYLAMAMQAGPLWGIS